MDNQSPPPNTKLSLEQLKILESMAAKAGILDTIKQHTNLIPTASDQELSKFVTNDSDMLKLKGKVKRLAESNAPVLITGETGTGKEIIARALHGKRTGKFVAINITALPNELLESELFGHTKGSFTGANENRVGLMEEANNGTLFLDEIGEMPIGIQAKLLRTLQEKAIRRVGDNKHIDITCRIVCATHCDLSLMIKEKRFRADLYWRIQYFILKTKPLRERREDVFEILDATLDPDGKIPEEVREEWSKMELEGNVRQLEALVQRYLMFGKDE